MSEYSHFNDLTKDNQGTVVQAAIFASWCLNCGFIKTNNGKYEKTSSCDELEMLYKTLDVEYLDAFNECETKRCRRQTAKEWEKVRSFLLELIDINCDN